MIVIWEERRYGRTDSVPGVFHIATIFWHCQFFPFFPRRSYIVLRVDAHGFQGVQIPLNKKSIAVAWLRATLFLAVLTAAIVALLLHQATRTNSAIVALTVAILAAIAFVFTYYSRQTGRATYERAMSHAQTAKLGPESLIDIGVVYQKLTVEDAVRLKDELAAAKPSSPEVLTSIPALVER